MKTKKVLKTIDVMTESVVKELNDMSERIDNFDKRLNAEVTDLANAINEDREQIADSSDKYDFLIKTIIEQNKQMNELIDIVDNKANHSYVQTIAKHVMNLESRVGELEKPKTDIASDILKCSGMENAMLQNIRALHYFNKAKGISVVDYIKSMADKKDKCECHTIVNPNIEVSYITASQVNDIIKEINRAKPQTDYFLKAKNLLIDYAESTMIKKGMEYTPIGDRFANFRPILGEKKTAIEKLIGYNAKHVQYCFMQESNMAAKTINELLEHWGDVFNYNVLGLAMQNTDKEPYYIVPYADRETQEKEIKNIVDNVKELTFGFKLNFEGTDGLYYTLLRTICRDNLDYIIYLFAKQLERLEN